MKKTVITAVLSLLVVVSFAEEKKVTVPEVVKKAFAAQYANATKVEWELEKEGEFEAEFKLSKTEMSVVFDAAGNLIETETEIEESELPQAIKATLAKDFAGYKIDDAVKAEAKGVVTYEMEAKKEKKEFELVFDANGKLLKQEEEKEDNEENNND
ncbi:MAG TPA: PepSY-like domain-containing protein [Prolixibacteraceae bacterium]|nr:PepSY-like domain-containing protein [Prolixibacteraceae bacterium]HPS13185.1 PepSY-like domain-containing protein [Prolixibacteraceae bacterium]